MKHGTGSARIIFRNSIWNAVEISSELLVYLATSIAVARVLGPVKLGHYVFLTFLTSIAGRLGGLGMAASTCKYMAEFLGKGEKGLARAVFFATLRLQILVAIGIAVFGFVLIFTLGEPGYAVVSYLLVLTLIPSLINNMPSQANIAAEDLSRNVKGALAYSAVYGITVTLALVFRWDLVGLATATLLARTVELVIRLLPVLSKMRGWPRVELPPDIRRRMRTFSANSMIITLVAIVVWDRSEVLFLKHYCDVRQLAFYSIAFGISERLLLASRAFASATGATLMAQHGRDSSRLPPIVANAITYLAVMAFPMHLGLVGLSGALVHLAYGQAYVPAIPVLMVALLLAIPKAFQGLPDTLYSATENQGILIRWMLLTAAVNLGLDALLIPRYGAIGAAWGNGLAQAFAVLGLWFRIIPICGLKIPYSPVSRIAVSAIGTAVFAFGISHFLAPLPALLLGVAGGIALFLLLLRFTRALGPQDRKRLVEVGSRAPGFIRVAIAHGLAFIIPMREPVAEVGEVAH
jgi:O-antigen/teichoic acid export membrane protein